MADERKKDDSSEPFRSSGSGDDYDPAGNWGAERRQPGTAGAGDGGFGPEGDYQGDAAKPNEDVLGEVNGSPDALIDEAQNLGGPKKHEH